jgi:two-component system response regulator DevR
MVTIPRATVSLMADLRVLLVDDHEVVRAGLRALLDAQDDMTVVGEAGSVEEGVRRVGFDAPDVVVLDVRLPDGSGVEACREIRSRFPEVKVLMLTSFADEEALMAAILAGASGYVLKRVKSDDLVADIRRVGAGESLLDAEMTDRLFERLRNGPKTDPLLSKLTDQESVIVGYIADGLTNRQIAEQMFLAEKTVKNYVSNVLTKLGMSRRSEAAAYVARVQADTGPDQPESWDDLGLKLQ